MRVADFSVLVDEVKEAEGLRLKAYRDSVGVWTVGYGTNLQELEIDQALADKWLVDKLAASELEAQRFPWFAGLTRTRQRAIVELIYNLGIPKLVRFEKFLAAMAAGDYLTARNELLDSRWSVQVGPTRANRIAGYILNG